MMREHLKISDTNGGKIGRLRRDAGLAAADLKEFLQSVKGNSPQEVLGLDSGAGLMNGLVWATSGIIVVLIIFSILPALFPKTQNPPVTTPVVPNASIAAPVNPTSNSPAAVVTPPTPGKPEETKTASTGTGKDDKTPVGAEDAIKKMGLNETKPGTPKDPFATKDDDLLKDK